MTLDDLIDAREIVILEQTYGPFPRQHHRLAFRQAYLEHWQESILGERRGEVVLVVQRRSGEVLLHTKTFYPPGVYRLPSGGVSWDEAVFDALRREAYEETGFTTWEEQFLGLVSYDFRGGGQSLPFVSYVFLLGGVEGPPAAQDAGESISDFCWVAVAELSAVAESLRSLEKVPGCGPGFPRNWGCFRALTHDFVAQRF